MGARLKNLAAKAFNAIGQNVYLFERRIVAFSLIAIIAFPLYYFIWHDIFPQPYENLPLRLFGSALFIPLIFTNHWPEWTNRYKPIYWYFAIFYALPFFFTFMLLKNGGSTVWLLSTLIAVFLMILLLDWLNLLIQFCLGVSVAWFAYYATTSTPNLGFITLESLPIFIFAIILGSIANYSAEIVQMERLRAMLATASNIAHELRTPLLGIKGGASGIRLYLPALLEAYRLAKQQGLPVQPIRQAHLSSMVGVLERIEAEVKHSNTIIDMLLMNTRINGLHRDNFSVCSAAQCVETALQRYSFASEKERQLVAWHPEGDFNFRGIELLAVHVLFNLLKNSLYYIAKADKGDISIRLQTAPQGNTLVFRDTGTGIPPEVLPHIFTRFYSWVPDRDTGLGTGIGLAFCRDVMHSFGGTIKCESRLGEYTEFSLTFPPASFSEKTV
ncbi:MAG TPA: HAMP domain-containing sensor histidine kinase [Gallionella sp.]|nr:HAMP domain-containing sensor histidine kinase [Gallionella sp.]